MCESFQLSTGRKVSVSSKGIRLGGGAYRNDPKLVAQSLAAMTKGDRRRCRRCAPRRWTGRSGCCCYA